MATAEDLASARAEWALANPWPWMLTGLAGTGTACLLAQAEGDTATPLRFLLILVGLLAAGVAVWLRLRTTGPAFVDGLPPQHRRLVLLGLAGFTALLALAATGLVVATVADEQLMPWSRGSVFLMWFLVAPWSTWLAVVFFRRSATLDRVSAGYEAGALLSLAAVAAFAASWAFYLGPDRAAEWDSIRLFLAVLALVAQLASPLVVVPRWFRRVILSVLVVLHFGGILTAVLSAPPTPWLAGQIWLRFYRPYLEFMYLNNAYHFYAPEPGPGSNLWFRVESEEPGTKKKHSEWFKIPDMDDNTGMPRYRLALEYQRMIAMVENTARNDPTPPMYVAGADGQTHYAPFFDERVKHSPVAVSGPVVVGADHDKAKATLIVPFHPELAPLTQYQKPNLASRLFVESFARFIMRKAAAKEPDLTPLHVKVYRVVHVISHPQVIKEGRDPCYPTSYVPYYLGEFDREGNMTRAGEQDPFLYWLLPFLTESSTRIQAFVFRHAGEPESAWTVDTEKTGLQTKLHLPEAH